jgi:hypothetical protein
MYTSSCKARSTTVPALGDIGDDIVKYVCELTVEIYSDI